MKTSSIVLWHVYAALLYGFLGFVAEMMWPALVTHRSFAVATGGIFLFLSFLITILSFRFIDHKNPYYFSYVTLFSVLVKLGIGIGMVAYYAKTQQPVDKLYAIPFILSYIIFTVCEVYILQLIIQSARKSWKK